MFSPGWRQTGKYSPANRSVSHHHAFKILHPGFQMKMEEMPPSGPDNTRLEALVHDIYSELVEDACLGLCFEVHRAVKQGYFFLDETDQESMKEFEIVDQPGVDIFGQVYNQWKNKECECPNCKRLIAASRFAPHLEKCLGMGRNSSRIANRRLASNNNISKSESDQEDNDDLNDNDWSYGAEKKSKKRKSDKSQNSPRRSKSLKHKNGELGSSVSSESYKYNYSSGISYETLGPDEVRSLLTTQCGVVSEHTKKMCTRPPLPDPVSAPDSDGFDIPDGQILMSRLQWEDSPDVSPTDSASSKTSTNHSDPRRPLKKKRTPEGGGESLSGGGGSGGSSSSGSQSNINLPNKKKRHKLSTPLLSSIYNDLN
ncbi:ataxin-7-like protein 3 isoform X3 [Synchiropus splendidus]|uniref:ataxin-7-like protein 3 isoform X3 n=1 Tax=Synchiropus splendidus TaxID=270530 RepID=UPI00237E641A|nr:ataxin-7-like protein 3 isoform X3 [Synchiropus splendidus]